MAIAVVLAGGSGSRMKSNIAKQYINLCGREVLSYSLETFQKHEAVTDIIIVVRAGEEEYCREKIVERYNIDKAKYICAGGTNRYDSVQNGLRYAVKLAEDNMNDIVMIHDGARPFVTAEMIDRSIGAAGEYGACTVGVPAKDTIKIVDDKLFGVQTPDRKYLYQIQTPQTFRIGLLKEAYEKMRMDENPNITDDTMLVEQYKGVPSKVVMGDYRNIKITTPEDIEIAEIFAKKIFKIF